MSNRKKAKLPDNQITVPLASLAHLVICPTCMGMRRGEIVKLEANGFHHRDYGFIRSDINKTMVGHEVLAVDECPSECASADRVLCAINPNRMQIEILPDGTVAAVHWVGKYPALLEPEN